MGFAERWISWIMFCVSSVEYRVLLNGQPNGLIVPGRGLRQGTSISIWTDPWVPAQFPRPALSNGPFKDPTLRLPHLIDRRTNSWRKDLLAQHFDPVDIALIEAIPLSSCSKADYLGWHFTKTGKYTVKSGYKTERVDVKGPFRAFGSGLVITPLLARVWKVKCPPKLQHFMWQVLSGCISVSVNLRRWGLGCDVVCTWCEMEEENINHAIFLCPPTRQVWALAHVLVGPQLFPTNSVYANVDHFLDSKNPGSQVQAFPWLMWYIWKARNTCVFENQTERPNETVQVAEGEALSWQEAQVNVEGEEFNSTLTCLAPGYRRDLSLPPVFTRQRCFVDASWKATDVFTGAGWCCISSQGSPPVLGVTNFRRSLSPLHAEVEAFIWAMRCMIGHNFRDVVFLTDCSDLVKMVYFLTDWPAFATYLDDIRIDREEFSLFSLLYVSRNANVRTDSLARQARMSLHHVLFVDNFLTN
ncbi:PREDICTED: uncharacterized protein LOC104728834 [Camelina sativa]|uniref:Uncharacterized protein LOC104728834 n=1 Tax=Camelina sativa TaxID=90675 RepID=A0ABM0UTF7_CAMSA|nr:PREDICTED: uncharacterized protein LOC104728834 [Camelina sativa]